jgi:DNA-binding NtrC family response regulator
MSTVIPLIYVVDDDESVRRALGGLVRSAGLTVQTFPSAQEFLAFSRPDVPSCLVLDVQLPGLSGLDLQQELAKADVQIPIIFLTGHGDIPMTVRAMKAGALEFLTKPFDDEDLLQAIHISSRSNRAFVKLNCAAIPSGLLESELFGHEKGAFTSAVAQRIGRFELANGGTLFLDEVGDIPLELQPKLLRIVQEQEFERLGSTRTIHADVRLVAATNRDLVQMTAEKEFREDLYFRLNVFPIRIAPLREREGDIPLLVRHYVDKYAQRMNKRIETIPEEIMAALCRYTWPGNVRELQNLIERAVILTSGKVLRLQFSDLQPYAPTASPPPEALEDVEREHILQILRETHGVVGGRRGAAVRLGVKRTTLISKMDRLGILRDPEHSGLT